MKLAVSLIPFVLASLVQAEPSAIRVGWIGPMSGPAAKYSAYEAALLAQEEINANGGINGRPLELLFEDGRGEGKSAASAAMKHINVNRVNYIIGGHCSPETMAIAPMAERSKTIMLAAITSNPMLTNAGEYIFRITAVSLRHADLLAEWAQKLNVRRVAILHEETDYARPPAAHLAELVKKNGQEVVFFEHYNPGETDFRSALTRIKFRSPDVIYFAVQNPDSAVLILQQRRELNIHARVFGNEIFGASVNAAGSKSDLYEEVTFGEPALDMNAPVTAHFFSAYKTRFRTTNVPAGFWSLEAYDAVRVLAETIKRCGDDKERVRQCLYEVKDFPGASGSISIDEHGDGVRNYRLKQIRNGKVHNL